MQYSIDGQNEELKHAKIVFGWHGTNSPKARSICESGFTYFGKIGYGASTDEGYFGSGIYFTESAKYALMYASGSEASLILSCVSMRTPFPVIGDLPFPDEGRDMRMLLGRGAYQNYNAHFVPVACVASSIFLPTYDQAPDCHEWVVFQKAQVLPCYLVEVASDMVQGLSENYSLSSWTACQETGLLTNGCKTPLSDENNALENFFFAAIYNNQLSILQTLYQKAPHLLGKVREGKNPMHVAAAKGCKEIAQWLYEKDPSLASSGEALSPLYRCLL